MPVGFEEATKVGLRACQDQAKGCSGHALLLLFKIVDNKGKNLTELIHTR